MVHFSFFPIVDALCGHEDFGPGDAVTNCPEKVTCRKCEKLLMVFLSMCECVDVNKVM